MTLDAARTGSVTPRWEWRCFGVAEDPFSARAPDRIEESDELYLLSRESDASVKVRDGLVDVKHRLETYDADVVQGTVLDRAEIDRQIERYRTMSAEQRRGIVGLQPDRAEVILAGACIVRTILTLLERDALTVSDRGLRHGFLVERFNGGHAHA